MLSLKRFSWLSRTATACGLVVTINCASAGKGTVQNHAPAQEFSVERSGKGPVMILIPGLLSGGDVWRATVDHFKDRYDIHVLTLAGFAGVPPIQADSFLATERDAIIRYIRDNRLGKPVIVGHSLGGFLALWVAATAPDLVGRVVSVDGVPFLPALIDTAATPQKSRAQAEQMRIFAGTMTPDQLAMQAAMALKQQSRDTANAALGAKWGRASDGATMGRAIAEMLTTDLRPQMARIKAPLLLIAAGDGMAPERQEVVIARYTSQVSSVLLHRVVMARNARHFIMLDDPRFLHSTIEEFIAR